MDKPYALCELTRVSDPERLNMVSWALEARGIESDVWDESTGWTQSSSRTSRLMVLCRDLVYARWIAYSVGVDTWPMEAVNDAG